MSSSERSRRRALLAAPWAAVLLAGCNLRPLYGSEDDPQLAARLAAIAIRSPPSELAQLLRNDLEDTLNPSGLRVPQAYTLAIEVEAFQTALAIQLDSTVTRYDLVLLASFALTENGAAEPLYTSAARRTASYNVVRQPFATLAAQRDAQRRAAAELARDIRTRVALVLSERAPA